MKPVIFSIMLLVTMTQAWAQSLEPEPLDPPEPELIALWPDGAPGAKGDRPEDIPSIQVYRADPAIATGAAMVICPGGGYGGLATLPEGRYYALYLNKAGVTGIVLRYRLGGRGYRHPIMLGDAARAVRYVRHHAQQWGIDPTRVGIMGSSAGGHLASTLLTHFDAGDSAASDPIDRQSSRPDLGVLCYPVITMQSPGVHAGSRRNLLGDKPSQELIELLSSEKQVTKDTPPCFIWHTLEDKSVPVSNSIDFALALKRHNVPFELHIHEKGRHGVGLVDTPPFEDAHPWGVNMIFWLRGQKFVAGDLPKNMFTKTVPSTLPTATQGR